MARRLSLVIALLVLLPALSTAQLLPLSAGTIVYGHHHLNTTNIEAFRKFWADTLGGTLVKIGTDNLEIVRFAGAVMFVRPMQAPTGGSIIRTTRAAHRNPTSLVSAGSAAAQRIRPAAGES